MLQENLSLILTFFKGKNFKIESIYISKRDVINNMYCPSCGAIINKLNQKFCEHCGAELAMVGQIKNQSLEKPLVSVAKSSLFDIRRNFYVLSENLWNLGSGDIVDEKGQLIGRIKRKFLSTKKKIDLLELDGTISASINANLIFSRSAPDLRDGQDNLIGIIKRKFTAIPPKFYLEDPQGRKWFKTEGILIGFSFKIKDLSTGKIVAEIKKTNRWRDAFLGELLDFNGTYALRIFDNETDRRALLGFTLSIDNALHDAK